MSEVYTERIESELRQFYGPQMDQIDRAVRTFETDKAKLLRPDGSKVWGNQEHAEREAALLATFDGMVKSVTEAAAAAIEDGKAELMRLGGATPMDALSEADLSRANSMALFVREDCESLPPHDLAPRVHAALAGTDRVAIVLWDRYLGRRLDVNRGQMASDPATLELLTLRRELAERLADPRLKDKRHKAERRIESAKSLTGRVTGARRKVDGSDERMLEGMRRAYAI